MSYHDLILQEGEFTYSANVQFDIESDRKLASFIPNEAMLSLLKEFFVDIIREQPIDHSRILYGSYGTGKSHFLTILSQLLGKKHLEGDAYNVFFKRVSDYDSFLANDIEQFVKNNDKKPFLVVPIVFDFEDFDRCIYFSLQRALERAQIKVNFKIFYTQAAELLGKWEASEESRERLTASCQRHGVELQSLKKSLAFMEKGSEEIFQEIFSDVTFGVQFIYETANIVEVLEQANQAIEDLYSGIIFIFDEFGRYMEDHTRNIGVTSVQRIAEYCDHNSWNDHIILVSHKEIAQYTKGYGHFISDEWKKVEGRYKAISINDKDEQCLTLLKHILIKDEEKWNQFKRKFSEQLDRLSLESIDFKGFGVNDKELGNLCEESFPLHPITLYTLDKLSKRVAQSERTFFTYLASRNEKSLYHFLDKYELDEFHFVGMNELYDYFEPSIQALQSDPLYDWYRKLQKALANSEKSSSDSCTEVRILKAIALIGILNEPEILTADRKTLLCAIDGEVEEKNRALDWLCEKRVIKYFGFYNRYEFYDSSIFDIDALIAAETANVSDEAMLKILNEELVDFVVHPYRYNRDYKISRVLVPVFTTSEEMEKKPFISGLPSFYDGIIIMLMGEADTSLEAVALFSCQIDRAIVFCNMDCQELKDAVRKYVALRYLELNQDTYIKEDPTFKKELEFHKVELIAEISHLLRIWRTNYNESSLIFIHGKEKLIHDEAEFNECASKLMYDNFQNTLIVNNELINKNCITSSIATAKRNAEKAILKGNGRESYYGLPLLSPDYISVRSVLYKNGFYEADGLTRENCLVDGGMPQREVKEKLDSVIEDAKKAAIEADTIIKTLKEPPFGLRDGYLSLLLTFWFAPYKKSLLIDSHGTEQEITAELFEEIVRRPHDFKIYISSWTSEQQEFLEELENLFYPYLDEALLNKNRLKAVYEAMFLHYKSITKFARVTEHYVSESCKKYRLLMNKSYTNYSKFIFTELNALTGDYSSTFALVQNVKEELETATEKIEKILEYEICSMLGFEEVLSISESLARIYKDSWSIKRGKAFDYYTNKVLEITGNLTGDEEYHEVISLLAKGLTGFEVEYWNDEHKEEFTERFSEVKRKLEQYQAAKTLKGDESKVILVSPDGKEQSMIFDRKELSINGNVLKNKIDATFQNFAQGVTYEEKVQVLLELLGNLVNMD